ncbi:GNAT family N-acetyltransferase [Planktotalea sp.]|uniref:GNAT family N-acetyltransferase n=1 Tax=Planktotalea sp. TaxID=2029877 RepID=UPI003D6A5D9A
MTDLAIRASCADDLAQILALYPLAFSDEDLTGLIAQLLGGEYQVTSLCAFENDGLVGHILFTRDLSGHGALLGPMAVSPARQRQGIGSALIKAGLDALKAQGVAQVFVLGDPGYYSRAGFTPERHVQPCYPIPEKWRDAWQSYKIGKASVDAASLKLPTPWMEPSLWG